MSGLNQHFPALVDWVNRNLVSPRQLRDEPARHRAGALQQAGEDGHVHGGYQGHVMKSSLYTRASLHPFLTTAVLAATGLALLAVMSASAGTAARYRLPHLR